MVKCAPSGMPGLQDMLWRRWVCGDEGHGAWPTVYQGLGVYREPVQGSMATPMQAHPAGMLPGADALHALPSLGQLPRLSYDFDAGARTAP